MSKPGRNDPCPCGSGRKYKRCCLGREAEHDAFADALEARPLPLLARLARFAENAMRTPIEEVARKDFPFWRTPLDEAMAARVVEHIIFEVRLERYGRTAIDEFLLEQGHALGTDERSMLDSWGETSRRLYRADGWSAGFLLCADAFAEQPPPIKVWPLGRDAGLIPDGAPVALRALAAAGEFICVGRPTTFGDRSLSDVAEAVRGRQIDYVRSQRIVGLDEFLRVVPTALDEEAAPTPAGIIVPNAR
jgi:SEC-C motif